MRLVTKSISVEHQILVGDEVFYLSETHISNTKRLKTFDVNSRIFSVHDNKIILQQKDDKKIFILDKNLKVLKIYESSNGLGHSNIENCVVIKLNDNIYTLTNNLELDPVVISFLEVYTYKNFIIQREKKSKIHAITREGQISWTYLLPEGETIDGSGLRFLDNLGIILTSASNLIIIDLKTGKELHKISNAPSDYLVDTEKKSLVSFAASVFSKNYLKVIDINLGKVILEKKFDNLPYNIRPMRSAIYSNKLYFICEQYCSEPEKLNIYTFPHIGRIDLTTYTIDWIEKVGDWKKEGQLFEAPIVIDNRIYLRDISGNAYIYEMNE